jgi:hypothetical protein
MDLEIYVSATPRCAYILWYEIISSSVENELLKGTRLWIQVFDYLSFGATG